MSAYAKNIARIGKEIELEALNRQLNVLPFPDAPSEFADPDEKVSGIPELQKNTVDVSSLQRLGDLAWRISDCQVCFCRELTSYHKWAKKIVIFVKRIIRKLVWFLLEPMVQEIEQNRISTASALEEIRQYLLKLDNADRDVAAIETAKLQAENEKLRGRLSKLEITVHTQQKLLNGLMDAEGGKG